MTTVSCSSSLWSRPARAIISYVALVLLSVSCTSTARAGPWSLEPPEKGFTLIFSGNIENGKPVDLSKTLRVRLLGPANGKAVVRAEFSDLAPDAYKKQFPNTHVIPKDAFSLDEKELNVDRRTDLTVSLKNQSVPGIYLGSVDLSIAGEPTAGVLNVPILIVIQEVPAFQLLNKPTTALLSNCSTLCALTAWLIPGSLRHQLHVSVLNKSPFAIKISANGLWRANQRGQGADSTNGVTQAVTLKDALDPKDPKDEVPALQQKDFAIPIDPERLPADHYGVDVQLTAQPVDQLILPPDIAGKLRPSNAAFDTLSLSMDVRDGALWPLVLVLLGVALGRAFSLLRSPSVVARLALYKQTDLVRQQIRLLQDPAAQASLNSEIDNLWTSLGLGTVTLQSFQDSLTDIAKKVQALLMQNQVLTAAATTVSANGLAQMQGLFQQAKSALVQPGVDVNALAKNDEAMKVYNQETGAALPAAAANQHLSAVKSRQNNVTRKVAAFFGIDTTERDTAFIYRYLRPFSYLVIILVVALSGAFSQYASAVHSTFGASAVDYLSIALWGFGAQVVGASFGDIQSLK